MNKPTFEKTIEQMKIGEEGYTVPWALTFDKKKTPYLNLDQNVEESPTGPFGLQIKRTGPNENDYEIINKRYTWGLEEKPFTSNMTMSEPRIVELNPNKVINAQNSFLEKKVEKNNLDTDEKKYPQTHWMRKDYKHALRIEDYIMAEELAEMINSTNEKL